MAIPVKQRGLDNSTMQTYEDTLLFRSMDANTEYWVPNQSYYQDLKFKIGNLRHQLKELTKDDRFYTSDVVNLLNQYALDLRKMENDEDYFTPYLKDPDCLTDSQIKTITTLLGRFKKNASHWGEDWCKRFLCCDTSRPLKIRKEQLQYVCYIMKCLADKELMNPDWANFVAKYHLFIYDCKVDAQTLQTTASKAGKEALEADKLLRPHNNLSEEERDKRRDERNELTPEKRDKYKLLNELTDIIKTL